MQKNICETDLYREAEGWYRDLRQPGSGQISDAVDVHISPDGTQLVFAGVIMEKLEGAASPRICLTERHSGNTRVVTFGPNTDRLPRFSPDGKHIAFLSDRALPGDFQLYLLDPASGAARAAPRVAGWIEYLQWSPDGRRILLGVAGHGADISGVQGAITSRRVSEPTPSWTPSVTTGNESHEWRRAWVYELATNSVCGVGTPELNVWEATWIGNDAIAAIVSPGPGEGLWYTARLRAIDVRSGETRELYTPEDQLGWPSGSPSGKHLAVVEALCSDRWFVAGDLRLIEVASGRAQRVATGGVDITYTEWCSEQRLLVAGHRGFETVIGIYDVPSATFEEVWSSNEITTGGLYVKVAALGVSGDCAIIGEGFQRAPEIAVIQSGEYRRVRSFDIGGYAGRMAAVQVEHVTWKAKDGLDIQGWLVRPRSKGPQPLVLHVHGGPVWQWRPLWLGRSTVHLLMLLSRGYAIFFPNPRGSTGRGQAFARLVLGDMAGADTDDFLSGIDHLVERGIADSRRLCLTGLSYGGFMTSWLITQDPRFAAAVAVAPIGNQVTEHLLSNIPHFVRLFLADSYTNPGGKYFQRSPIMHAHKAKTPTLIVCGALDRCTPPEEGMQFHNALKENGCESVLVTYPEEGHGIRKLPAAIDYAARVVSWFEQHLPATEQGAA